MIIDLHNHTTLCNHATGTIKEYIEKAIENKTQYFGFSEHAPMNFDKEYRLKMEDKNLYEKTILNYQKEYKREIDILLGYEVDFLPHFIEEEILKADVDYLIGSVHFLNRWGFDNPEFIGEYQNRDIDTIWEEYFNQIAEMAKSGYFDIVGHLDLIKVFKFLPKKDIREIAKNAIREIKKANMVVELNTAGYRKPIKEPYPSKKLLELIAEYDIPITFGSDAHSPNQVGLYKNEIYQLAKECGYSKVTTFKKRDREEVEF